MFIGTFNSRVDDLIFLTDDEKNVYKKQNEDAVINHVIPGYNALITTLASFKELTSILVEYAITLMVQDTLRDFLKAVLAGVNQLTNIMICLTPI